MVVVYNTLELDGDARWLNPDRKEGRGPSERSNSVHTTPKCDASEFVGFRRSRRRRSRRQGRSSVGRCTGAPAALALAASPLCS
eukprot:scaffold133234_cov66-Phaeocystis_antarctica.AAC.8